MNLPLVFDIALGLLFIYLIMSLLASEIQELLTTLLQWRAHHLKQSIEILILGDEDGEGTGGGTEFVDRLYGSPLLKALNQEAKGPVAKFFRVLCQRIGHSFRSMTGTRNIFGTQKSGPSYIPSETFVKALLENLDIQNLVHQKSTEVLQQAIEEKLEIVRRLLEQLRQDMDDDTFLVGEFEDLRHRLNSICLDFSHRQLTFSTTVTDLITQVKSFVENTQVILQDDDQYKALLNKRLPYVLEAIATQKLEPTIASVVQSTLEQNPVIPTQLKRSLNTLANNTKVQARELADEFQQFETSLSQWFDQSMTRASGVYKRNAKGVAFIVGFLIAVASNTDTVYIVTRLSTDSVLRNTIVQTANQVEQGQFRPNLNGTEASASGETPDLTSDTVTKLRDVRDAVQLAMEDLPLPIGWTEEVIAQQQQQEARWFLPFLRRLIGWLVTGIALSMGASFWYNLIGKLIQIRNTGDNK
ncbi:MAG: hypothetical protein VKJ64_04895 [Leptolyngbyaceae bacterium]|nr:hypothetical protein [Leptolyngbyaceae bacterium]